ncbi:hypothetical protein THRCLA_08719 [Thraustotheca clavata]|uniref:Uncharacterized protein n=1 Tax=Thraustotheca clavata TaxID=74557 RepID=A0A1V9Z3A9_9STRA|nr:hypothetical protein THRCLA_08719 [Thraustotheca clavata]
MSSVIDLVSSSSSDEETQAIPHEIIEEEDEPLPIPSSHTIALAAALESALVDLESEESEEDEALPRLRTISALESDEDEAFGAVAISNETKEVEKPIALAPAVKEEGEISGDDADAPQDALWKEKKLQAECLREVIVAQRKAEAIKKMNKSLSMRKKPKKKRKRKLSASASPDVFNKRQVVMESATDSILRVHRHGMVENLTPYHGSPLLPSPHAPPPFMPPLPVYHPPPLPSSLTASPAKTATAPLPASSPLKKDPDAFDLESLRKAVLRSKKKAASVDSANEQASTGEATTIADTPSPPLPVQKMVLGPSSLSKASKYQWTNPQLHQKRPLTALTQTLVINLSMDDCERARELDGSESVEQEDPIAKLKQKIAEREEALRQGKKISAAPSPQVSAVPSPEPSAYPSPKAFAAPSPEPSTSPSPKASAALSPEPSANSSPKGSMAPSPQASPEPPVPVDDVKYAEAQIARLAARIRELKQRIAAKTIQA